MALVLKFDICQSGNCKKLTMRETTGLYSASVNTTGWGSPNHELTDVNSATLTITKPDSTTSTIDLTTHGFPTDNTYYEYPFDSTYLGDATAAEIPDGVYKFVYTVVAAGTTYTTTVLKLLHCQIECCVHGMFADIQDPECDCATDKLADARKAFVLLQGLKYAASCGQKDAFAGLLEILNRLCTNSNCTTCQ
jgi:hypothetical protein